MSTRYKATRQALRSGGVVAAALVWSGPSCWSTFIVSIAINTGPTTSTTSTPLWPHPGKSVALLLQQIVRLFTLPSSVDTRLLRKRLSTWLHRMASRSPWPRSWRLCRSRYVLVCALPVVVDTVLGLFRGARSRGCVRLQFAWQRELWWALRLDDASCSGLLRLIRICACHIPSC